MVERRGEPDRRSVLDRAPLGRLAVAAAVIGLGLSGCAQPGTQAPRSQAAKLAVGTSDISAACGYLEELTAFGGSKASKYALALAFAGFMSMFPLILGALSIIGLAIRDPSTEGRFRMLVLQVFLPDEVVRGVIQ